MEWDSFFIRLMGRSKTFILLIAAMRSGREAML
jgi:6-phosphofructokinase